MAVGKNLDFDMTRPRQVFFDQHAVVAEGACRLPLCSSERLGKLFRAGDDSYASAPAAGGCLDQHRKADLLGRADKTRGILVFAEIPRDERHPRSLH